MLPLVSGINSRLLSVNHALISPILTRPVSWVALPLSITSTHHSRHSSPPHSFIPVLKPPCLKILASIAFLFFFGLHGFPGLFTDTSEHIHFSFLVFPHFISFWFRAVDYADLGCMSLFERTLKWHLVSYCIILLCTNVIYKTSP